MSFLKTLNTGLESHREPATNQRHYGAPDAPDTQMYPKTEGERWDKLIKSIPFKSITKNSSLQVLKIKVRKFLRSVTVAHSQPGKSSLRFQVSVQSGSKMGQGTPG